jgi:gluconokinase
MTSYMLGIDIGTTSTKAVLFSEKGEVSHQV